MEDTDPYVQCLECQRWSFMLSTDEALADWLPAGRWVNFNASLVALQAVRAKFFQFRP